MSEDAPELDRADPLGALLRHGGSFVLVGGLAAQAHGASRATKDADLCPDWTLKNLARPATTLSDFDARLTVGGIGTCQRQPRRGDLDGGETSATMCRSSRHSGDGRDREAMV